ncbi:hypothetical protein BDQ17DRAFT_1279277 [Cyathus striatus]|nr:hypothetical protein BDQ17DRAFT_1279277 [Cyathus striatus]
MGAHESTMKLPRNPLELLKYFDTVIIVDDSASMKGHRWKQAGEALSELALTAAQYDSDGIDIYFPNSRICGKRYSNRVQVEELFNKADNSEPSDVPHRIEQLITSYLKRWEHHKNTVKPVNFIVLTDGEFENNTVEDLESIIRNAATKLDELNAPLHQIGIQFVQIGTDASAGMHLRKLDDDLKEKYQIRDIVDTTQVEAGKDLELSKILVGAVHRRVDNKGIRRRFHI